jgi:hypothetical protein
VKGERNNFELRNVNFYVYAKFLRKGAGKQRRTEEDSVKLVGVLVHVREEDAAGLQHCEERSLSGLSKRRQELVGAFVHAQLQCCRIVCDGPHFLHDVYNTMMVSSAAK